MIENNSFDLSFFIGIFLSYPSGQLVINYAFKKFQNDKDGDKVKEMNVRLIGRSSVKKPFRCCKLKAHSHIYHNKKSQVGHLPFYETFQLGLCAYLVLWGYPIIIQ